MVKNSTLRFCRVLPYYFVYHEEYFLMNKTQYKLFFTVFQRCSVNNVLKQTTQFYRKTPMYESMF